MGDDMEGLKKSKAIKEDRCVRARSNLPARG